MAKTEINLEKFYDAWARHEASQLKNRSLEEFKQKFRPVRIEENCRMIVQDSETLEEHIVHIEQDWVH